MKRLQIMAACLVVLVLAGVSCMVPPDPVNTLGQAIVRTVRGAATYTTGDGTTKPLKVNTLLNPGDTIATPPDAFVYLNVNGYTSALRIGPETTLVFDRMDHAGIGRVASQDTKLNLKRGFIVGQVKKITGDSKFEIETPHGMAGIRGTDYAVDVGSNGIGQYAVTFTSLTGTVVASADVKGQIQTKTLNGGESWTVGGEVVPVNIELRQFQLQLLEEWNPPVQRTLSAVTSTPVTVQPVFPYGAAPLGPNRPPR